MLKRFNVKRVFLRRDNFFFFFSGQNFISFRLSRGKAEELTAGKGQTNRDNTSEHRLIE